MRRKLHIKKTDASNKRGFTLVEVLAVVVIVAVVGGISISVYLNVINKSKEKANVLAINNLKEAALLYSKEESNDIDWLNQYEVLEEGQNPITTNQYTCMTVRELINKGYFKESFFEQDIYKNSKINDNTYIQIIRDYDNKSNLEINILPEVSDQMMCEIQASKNSFLSIDKIANYTDRFNITFKPNDNSTYKCYMYDKSGNVSGPSNNTCNYTKLKNNTRYTAQICLEKDNNNTCLLQDVMTYDFKDINITIKNENKWQQSKEVTIEFYDENIYNKAGIHYFKSDVNANVTNGTVYVCTDEFKNNSISCSSNNTEEISSGIWYKVEDKSVTLEVAENIYDESKKIYARIYDPTGNNKENSKVIKKINNKAPTCSVLISSGTKGENNYYISDVGVKIGNINSYGVPIASMNLGTSKSTTTYNNKSVGTQTKDSAGTTWYGTIKDEAGNVGTCSLRIKKDATKPSCSINLDKTPDGTNDYYKSNVTISLTKSDDTSGVLSYGLSVNENSNNNITQVIHIQDTNGTTYYGSVKDKAGNVNTCSKTIKKDSSGPSTPTSEVRLENSTGTVIKNSSAWTSNTIWWGNYKSTDSGSGIDHYEYSTKCTGTKTNNLASSYTYPLSGKTTHNSYYCIRAVDKAGNTSSWSNAYYFNVDQAKPTIPTSNIYYKDSSWTILKSKVTSYNSNKEWTNKTLKWTDYSSADSGSGVDHYEYSTNCTGTKSNNLNTSDGYSYSNNDYKFCIRAVDKVGNTSSWSSPYYFRVDTTAPTFSLTCNSSDFYDSSGDFVTTSVTAKVTENGSGINTSLYNYHHCRTSRSQICGKSKGLENFDIKSSTIPKNTDYVQKVYYTTYYKMNNASYIQYTYWKFCDNAGNCRYANFKLDIEANSCTSTRIKTSCDSGC